MHHAHVTHRRSHRHRHSHRYRHSHSRSRSHSHSIQCICSCVKHAIKCLFSNAGIAAALLEAGAYDPWGPNESYQAARLELPWDMRGDPDAKLWRGNRRRPSGRHANAGGSRKEQYDIYWKSGADAWFHPNHGGLVCMHMHMRCPCGDHRCNVPPPLALVPCSSPAFADRSHGRLGPASADRTEGVMGQGPWGCGPP